MSDPRVAVVIPTYQRATLLPGIVEALERQTLPLNEFEVVISDDCSSDETPRVLDELASGSRLKLRIVSTERNSGPATARNVAWRTTDAPILAFMDDDCVPTPGWLENGLRHFEDPDVAIVQGATLPDPTASLDHGTTTQWIDRLSKRYEACNIFYRRQALESVGGFDESIRAFGEDSVPAWSIRRRGGGVRFGIDALVHHEVRFRGIRWHARWSMLFGNFPMLVRRFPELRRDLLWLRIFSRPKHALFFLAIAGIAWGVFWWPAFTLTVPLVSHYVPLPHRPRTVVLGLTDLGLDALAVASLVVASVRHRTLVL